MRATITKAVGKTFGKLSTILLYVLAAAIFVGFVVYGAAMAFVAFNVG